MALPHGGVVPPSLLPGLLRNESAIVDCATDLGQAALVFQALCFLSSFLSGSCMVDLQRELPRNPMPVILLVGICTSCMCVLDYAPDLCLTRMRLTRSNSVSGRQISGADAIRTCREYMQLHICFQ